MVSICQHVCTVYVFSFGWERAAGPQFLFPQWLLLERTPAAWDGLAEPFLWLFLSAMQRSSFLKGVYLKEPLPGARKLVSESCHLLVV